jgi:hypothetical protein
MSLRPSQYPLPDAEVAVAPNAEADLIGMPARRVRGPWGAWLRLTMPRYAPQQLREPRVRERVRRARLLSTFLAAALVVGVVLIPKAFFPIVDPGTLSGVGLAMVLVVLCGILSRARQVTAAGLVFTSGVALALALSLIFTPNGLGMQDLPTFDLFAMPVVIAGILLPRRASLGIWAACALFTGLDLQFEPHQANLNAYIAQVSIYGVAILPILLAGILAVVSWLAAGSVASAIAEAGRTADLERANTIIAAQKRQLEDGLAAIQAVHARVANGDLSARATISSGELLPLAISLNLMLERLSRSLAAEYLLGGMEAEVQRLTYAVGELAQGHLRQPVALPGGGPLAQLAQQIERLRLSILQLVQTAQNQAQHLLAAADNVEQGTRFLAQQAPSELAETLDHLLRAERQVTAISQQIQQAAMRLRI